MKFGNLQCGKQHSSVTDAFIHSTFDRCLSALCACVCVRRCALRFNSRETYGVFKTSNNPVHLEQGRCGSEETAAKI